MPEHEPPTPLRTASATGGTSKTSTPGNTAPSGAQATGRRTFEVADGELLAKQLQRAVQRRAEGSQHERTLARDVTGMVKMFEVLVETLLTPATVRIEAAIADPAGDFNAVVDSIPETQLNAMAGFKAWLNKIVTPISGERFAYLAANIMLVSKHARGARKEALRLLKAMLQDKDTALRMILKPVQAVIVPRNKQMTELDEFRSLLTSDSGKGPGKTFDGREWAHVRGVGNVVAGGKTYAAITEENLLGGAPDAKVFDAPKNAAGVVVGSAATPGGSYTVGYSTTTHEFAHVLHANGLSADQKKIVKKHYDLKRAATTGEVGLVKNVWPDGPRVSPTAPASWTTAGWTDATRLTHLAGLTDDARRVYECYSSQNEFEYFAQTANAYLGTNLGTDPTTGRPRNNGRAWIAVNEPTEMMDLLDLLFKNTTVNDINANGTLKTSGLCTNPAPAPVTPPTPPATPPVTPPTGGTP
jgi:hypothetical protein